MTRTSATPVHRLELVGVGSVVVDRIARTPRIIGPEEKISLMPGAGGLYLEHVGGVTLNHLAWASLMGASVGLAGRAATDKEATVVREGMRRHGITPHLIEDGSATAVSLIFVDPQGERAIYMSRGTNGETDATHLRHHHGDWLRAAKYVSTEISQVPLDGVVEVLEQARAGGAITVLDLDIPKADALASLGTPAQFDRALALADILKPAKGALQGLGITADDALGYAAALRDRFGSAAVVVTDGARGCALASESFSGRL
ncbi:MAG: carbohydrate kinase family protein, partial [Nannocystaceae bacterium]